MVLSKYIKSSIILLIFASSCLFAQDDGQVDMQSDQQVDEQTDQPADTQPDQSQDQYDDTQQDQPVDMPQDQLMDQPVDQPMDQQGDPQQDQSMDQQTATVPGDADMNLSIDELQAKLDAANQQLEQAKQEQSAAQDNLDTILSYYKEPAGMGTDAKSSVDDVSSKYQTLLDSKPLADKEEYNDLVSSLQDINNSLQSSKEKVTNLQMFLQFKIDQAQTRKDSADAAVATVTEDINRIQNLIDIKNSNAQ